jgi:hypothetical protein
LEWLATITDDGAADMHQQGEHCMGGIAQCITPNGAASCAEMSSIKLTL